MKMLRYYISGKQQHFLSMSNIEGYSWSVKIVVIFIGINKIAEITQKKIHELMSINNLFF